MKKLFNEFVSGDSVKKLAIIADFTTILGISVATLVAGPFLSKFTNIEFIVTDFLLSIIFYFLCFLFVLDFLYTFIQTTHKNIKEKNNKEVMGGSVLALFVLWIAIVSFPYVKYFVGNTFNVSYLLSQTAMAAVTDVIDIKSIQKGDITRVSGVVKLNKNTNAKDYVALMYRQNGNGLYEIVKFIGTGDYASEISKNGSFSIPLKKPYDSTNDSYIIIYRKSDWSLTQGIGVDPGYPNKLTHLPHNETDNVGAFVTPLKNLISN